MKSKTNLNRRKLLKLSGTGAAFGLASRATAAGQVSRAAEGPQNNRKYEITFALTKSGAGPACMNPSPSPLRILTSRSRDIAFTASPGNSTGGASTDANPVTIKLAGVHDGEPFNSTGAFAPPAPSSIQLLPGESVTLRLRNPLAIAKRPDSGPESVAFGTENPIHSFRLTYDLEPEPCSKPGHDDIIVEC
jgi:hypothetical protein